jgi:hypothetical protein
MRERRQARTRARTRNAIAITARIQLCTGGTRNGAWSTDRKIKACAPPRSSNCPEILLKTKQWSPHSSNRAQVTTKGMTEQNIAEHENDSAEQSRARDRLSQERSCTIRIDPPLSKLEMTICQIQCNSQRSEFLVSMTAQYQNTIRSRRFGWWREC